MKFHETRAWLATAAAVLALSACGGGSGGAATPAGPATSTVASPAGGNAPAPGAASGDASTPVAAVVPPATPVPDAPPVNASDPPAGPPSPPVPAPTLYGALRNDLKGQDTCLALGADDIAVEFAPCAVSDRQRWSIRLAGSDRFIYNAWLDAQASSTPKCMTALGYTVPGKIVMAPCTDPELEFKRGWLLNSNADGRLLFANAYRSRLLGVGPQLLESSSAGTVPTMQFAVTDASAAWSFDGVIEMRRRPLLGNLSALLISVSFDDMPAHDPEPARKAVFGNGDDYASLRHYLAVASRGKVDLTGKMVSGINLGAAPTDCLSAGILARAKTAVQAQGIDPSAYGFVFVDAPFLHCGWGAQGQLAGNTIVSSGSGNMYWTWTHEFGHNMGLQHSVTWRNCPIEGGRVVLGPACLSGPFGDLTDTMGGGGGRLYPVDYRLHAGWLTDDEVPIVRNGTYTLAPLGSANGLQGLRLLRSDATLLLLEFRQPMAGFDNWPAGDPFVQGVIVRTVASDGAGMVTNSLVDATPGTPSMTDAPLLPGQSLQDVLAGKVVTVESTGPGGAVVRIDDIPSR